MTEMLPIIYRGYEIYPVNDLYEHGFWTDCYVEEATFFEIYPPNTDDPKLDVEAYTLAEAIAAIDKDIE